MRGRHKVDESGVNLMSETRESSPEKPEAPRVSPHASFEGIEHGHEASHAVS